MATFTGRKFRPDLVRTSSDASRRPGGYGEGSKPDPIPNSVVKTLSADGTAASGRGRVGRCLARRMHPIPLHSRCQMQSRLRQFGGAFFVSSLLDSCRPHYIRLRVRLDMGFVVCSAAIVCHASHFSTNPGTPFSQVSNPLLEVTPNGLKAIVKSGAGADR